jgi:hypothetical protein
LGGRQLAPASAPGKLEKALAAAQPARGGAEGRAGDFTERERTAKAAMTAALEAIEPALA